MCGIKDRHNYTADAEVESGIGEGRAGLNDTGVWRWAAGLLGSVVLVLVGAFLGDLSASVRYAGLTAKLDEHSRAEGHPVMVQRVDDIKNENREAHNRLVGMIEQIQEKQERQSFVLREIEQKVTVVANGNGR